MDSNPPDGVNARSVTINGDAGASGYYTVEYDDSSGTDAYRVSTIGANSNAADVSVLNLVQVRPNNSAGLAQSSKIDDVWSERGLDSSDPTTNTKDKTENTRLTINHSGDPETSVTSTRA